VSKRWRAASRAVSGKVGRRGESVERAEEAGVEGVWAGPFNKRVGRERRRRGRSPPGGRGDDGVGLADVSRAKICSGVIALERRECWYSSMVVRVFSEEEESGKERGLFKKS